MEVTGGWAAKPRESTGELQASRLAPRAAAAAPVAATAPAGAAGPGRGQLNLERPAVHRVAVELPDCLRGSLGGGHLDEPEAARPSGVPVYHDGG